MPNLSRRQLLSATAAAAFSATLPGLAAAGVSRQLVCQSRVLDVNGKAATVLGLGGDGALPGLVLGPDERFRVSLINRLAEPTLVHWHGLIPPNAQDGVPDVTQPALAPGASHHYDFQPHAGSHWMHSHVGLQRQNLLSAPLIVRSRDDLRADMQEHVMFLHDFTFRDPEEILAGLIAAKGHGHAPGGMQHPNAKKMGHRMSDSGQGMQSHDRSNAHGARQHGQSPAAPMKGPMPGHMNDVEFDAYLANDRTLDDPEIVRVERGGRLRLRLINGAAATNFVIDLGQLDAQIVAVDGNPVRPVTVSAHLPLAMAQRVDVMVQLPAGEGSWPVLALREGALQRTGIILATRNAVISKISTAGHRTAPPTDNRLERHLRPLRRLPRRDAARHVRLRLTGGMMPYRWGIDGRKWGEHSPVRLKQGERVALTFDNATDMAHPMHIHGHHFQITAINGVALDGPFRDTVLVPVKGQVTVAFDAGAPGRWLVHCHNAYHMVPGMMTEIII